MTKMQIIAKAVLTFLGISAFVNFSQNFTMITSSTRFQHASVLHVTLFSFFLILLLTAIVYWLILKNDWLVCKIAGSGKKLSLESETFWLTGSLRMVAIAYGLILLSGSIATILNILALPLYLCPLINEICTFRTFPKSIAFTSRQWSYMIYDLFKALLAVYLLCGWPQFIRYQLNLRKNETFPNQNPDAKGIKNE